ncbi:MAG: hypothetical protein GX620_18725 [Chloroflexi bacterium]|nr:hypothetical protein [Chloroflexota bacterium]
MNAECPGPWYHGSPLELEVLRAGSTVTQECALARIFSHKPSLVSISDDGEIRHDGKQPGYLYEVVEEVRIDDVTPHPHTSIEPGKEWLTTRELRVSLLGTTSPAPEELLGEAEIKVLRMRLANS